MEKWKKLRNVFECKMNHLLFSWKIRGRKRKIAGKSTGTKKATKSFIVKSFFFILTRKLFLFWGFRNQKSFFQSYSNFYFHFYFTKSIIPSPKSLRLPTCYFHFSSHSDESLMHWNPQFDSTCFWEIPQGVNEKSFMWKIAINPWSRQQIFASHRQSISISNWIFLRVLSDLSGNEQLRRLNEKNSCCDI